MSPTLLSLPLQALYFCPPSFSQAVIKLQRDNDYDLVHIHLARTGRLTRLIRRAPVVIDFVDCLSLSMARRAMRESWPVKWLFQLEANRLCRYEQELIKRTRLQVVNSPANKKALGEPSSVKIVPNGVAIEQFVFHAGPSKTHDIVLSGNMGYFPHADAACVFARDIFPGLRARFPNARFLVVGANPSSELRRLAGTQGVLVTGAVPDIRPYIRGAAAAVAPSMCGNGLQLKILEAMALGTPVVATAKAVADAPLVHGRDLLIADTHEEFGAHVSCLLADSDLALQLKRNARQRVEEIFTWERSAREMSRIYQEAMNRSGSNAGGPSGLHRLPVEREAGRELVEALR